VLGAGVGLFYSSITTAAVTALDPSRSSLAGGIVYMFQVAGGSVGLGVATTVFDSVQRSHDFATAFTWSFRLVAALALAGLLVTILSVRPEDRDEAPAGAGAGAAG
jgi:hypothetical protein